LIWKRCEGLSQVNLDADFRLAARERFNIQLERNTADEGYLAANDDKPLVRLGSSIDNFCNSITLKNYVLYICRVPTFSLFLRQVENDSARIVLQVDGELYVPEEEEDFWDSVENEWRRRESCKCIFLKQAH
jgi:hypothetical protein